MFDPAYWRVPEALPLWRATIDLVARCKQCEDVTVEFISTGAFLSGAERKVHVPAPTSTVVTLWRDDGTRSRFLKSEWELTLVMPNGHKRVVSNGGGVSDKYPDNSGYAGIDINFCSLRELQHMNAALEALIAAQATEPCAAAAEPAAVTAQ